MHEQQVAEYLTGLKWAEPPDKVTYWRKSGRHWLYQIEVEGKPAYILKLYRSGWHNREREALALAKLQELSFGSAPQLIYQSAGVADFEGRSLLIYAYISGEGLTPQTLTTAQIGQIAHLLTRLYQINPSSDILRLSKPQTIARYWQETASVLKSVNFDNPYQKIMGELTGLAQTHLDDKLLLNEQKLSLIHGDLELSNFVVSTNHSLHLLDWEQFGAGDAAIDLAWFLFLNRFSLSGSQKEILLDQIGQYSNDPNLKARTLQFYPLLQFRYLLSYLVLRGQEKSKPVSEPEKPETPQDWLLEALYKLKGDFETFKGEQGLHLLEKTLTPMPLIAEQATPKSPAFVIRQDRPNLYLTFLNGAYDGFSRLLPLPERFQTLELLIGRQEGCAILLNYDNLLSRKHARLTIELDENYELHGWLEDLGSQNGTYLQSEKLGKGHWLLEIGQEFRVGATLLQLDFEATTNVSDLAMTELANSSLINSLDEVSRFYLRSAEMIAQQSGTGWVGVEHLFQALLADEKEATATLLRKLHLKPAEVLTKLKLLAGGQHQNNAQNSLPLTPRLQMILERVGQLAAIAKENRQNKPPDLAQHRYLITAILEDESSLPSRLFADEGYDLNKLLKHLK
jgi:thiamine kinase-like enzyme/pSer/pThr/pTyr-binding forkhead associated (FHA) protein